MSREDFEQLDASMKDAPKKKKMTVEKFFQQFLCTRQISQNPYPIRILPS